MTPPQLQSTTRQQVFFVAPAGAFYLRPQVLFYLTLKLPLLYNSLVMFVQVGPRLRVEVSFWLTL
jgi:hypothetical protein